MSKKKLTTKQKIFVLEYIKDFNATRAAKAAGYSEKTAKQIGSENLTKPVVQQEIAKAVSKRAEKLEINAEWVLRKGVELHDRCVEADDRSTTARALEIVGKHVDIAAFDNTITHTGDSDKPIEHNHNLTVKFVDPPERD